MLSRTICLRISRVVDKETGDIKFRGPDGKVYDNIPKDTIYVDSKGIAAVGGFPEEMGANVLKELSGNAKKLTKKDGPALFPVTAVSLEKLIHQIRISNTTSLNSKE